MLIKIRREYFLQYLISVYGSLSNGIHAIRARKQWNKKCTNMSDYEIEFEVTAIFLTYFIFDTFNRLFNIESYSFDYDISDDFITILATEINLI